MQLPEFFGTATEKMEAGNRALVKLVESFGVGLVKRDPATFLGLVQVQLSLHVKMISYTLSSHVFFYLALPK